ncbi:YitT family protein [candidate division KSB1 bacterium]|nr:YitT family protein [candidate division KSB1 bacterium]
MAIKQTVKKIVIEYLAISFGAILTSLGLILFLVPAKIAPGGVSGLGMIFYHLFGWPVGWTMLALNIPLFILGLKVLGKQFGARTAFAFSMVSISYEIFDRILKLQPATNDQLLSAVFGGIVLGIGLGIVFRAKGTTGGSDILGQVIHKYSNISVGIGILIVDFFVISFSGLAFRDVTLALYGFMSLYASSKIIDIVMDGFDYARSLFIISDKQNEIMEVITEEMQRGGTLIKGTGFFTQQERNILFTVVTRKEVATIRQIVKEIDPKAFIIISNVHEVLGEGFRPRI